MISAAPRKNANGEASIRPYLTGTSSATRFSPCSSRRAIGSGRSCAGAHAPWLDRGAPTRAAFPRATRSSSVSERPSGVLRRGCVGRAIFTASERNGVLRAWGARRWTGATHGDNVGPADEPSVSRDPRPRRHGRLRRARLLGRVEGDRTGLDRARPRLDRAGGAYRSLPRAPLSIASRAV